MITYIKNNINNLLFSHKVIIEKDYNDSKFIYKHGNLLNNKFYREQPNEKEIFKNTIDINEIKKELFEHKIFKIDGLIEFINKIE